MSLANATLGAISKETVRLFAQTMKAINGFESSPALAVAVSGGADSMALLLLAKHWADQHHGTVTALTVDHGLRPESATEAQIIGDYCKQLGIIHHILRWTPSPLTSAIQAEARHARYRLLGGWCQMHGVLHLLTAHHQDDQAETLIFRLARGSGPDGLSGMAAVSYQPYLRILRPLLGMTSSQLHQLLYDTAQPWIEDPTNQSMRYTRNVIRKTLHDTGNHPVLSAHAASLASRFGTIRNHMETKLASHLANCVSIYPEGYATLSHRGFCTMPDEYGLRCLSAIAQTLSGTPYRLRTGSLEQLCQRMQRVSAPTRYTLGGLQFTYQSVNTRRPDTRWMICREAHAVAGRQTLSANTSTCWDKRFVVHYTSQDSTLTDIFVGPLGHEGKRIIRDLRLKHPLLTETPVLNQLPALWHLDELIAVPHIQYHHPDYRKMHCFIAFLPAKSLAASAFSGMNNLSVQSLL
jgi:tRNA(Ile)-lysidine synthase